MSCTPTAPARGISRSTACCASRMPSAGGPQRPDHAALLGRAEAQRRRGTSTPPSAARAAPARTSCAAARPARSYAGDDFFVSVARPPGARPASPIRRLDIRALCTNRDLPILDDSPTLTLEIGRPGAAVRLLGPFRRPRPSLAARACPQGPRASAQIDDLTWRWIGAAEPQPPVAGRGTRQDAEPLRAMLELYADRGDPALARHARSIVRVRSAPGGGTAAASPGPICFGHGTEITLEIDEAMLSGGSRAAALGAAGAAFRPPCRRSTPSSAPRPGSRSNRRRSTWPMTPRPARPDLSRTPTPPRLDRRMPDFFELLRARRPTASASAMPAAPEREPARLGQNLRAQPSPPATWRRSTRGQTPAAGRTSTCWACSGPEGPMPLHLTRWVLARLSDRWFAGRGAAPPPTPPFSTSATCCSTG